MDESGKTANHIAVSAGISAHTVTNILRGNGTHRSIRAIESSFPEVSKYALIPEYTAIAPKGIIEAMQSEIDELRQELHELRQTMIEMKSRQAK